MSSYCDDTCAGTAEVESSLVSHPLCAEAAVVGVEHEIKGQSIYAFVTLMEGGEYSEEVRRSLVRTVRGQIGAFAAPDKVGGEGGGCGEMWRNGAKWGEMWWNVVECGRVWRNVVECGGMLWNGETYVGGKRVGKKVERQI